MYESPSWLHELWLAREVLWQGFLTSVQVSALAILLGTVLGVFAGLVLTYGKFWMRAPFRFYVDLIRGTPVFVLVLACFYMAPALITDTTPGMRINREEVFGPVASVIHVRYF